MNQRKLELQVQIGKTSNDKCKICQSKGGCITKNNKPKPIIPHLVSLLWLDSEAQCATLPR